MIVQAPVEYYSFKKNLVAETGDIDNHLHIAAKEIFKEYQKQLDEFEQYKTVYANSLNRPKISVNMDALKELGYLFQNFKNAKHISKEEILKIKEEKPGYDLESIKFLDEGFQLFKSAIKMSKKNYAVEYIDSPYKKISEKISLLLKVIRFYDNFSENTGCHYFSSELDTQQVMDWIKEGNKTLNLILELATRDNCEPSLITQTRIDAFELELKEKEVALQQELKEKEAKLAWEALYKSAPTKSTQARKKTSKSNINKKTKNKKKCIKTSKKESAVQTPLIVSSKELIIPIKKNETELFKIDPFDEIIKKIYKQESRFTDLRRVTKRWETKIISMLQEITDRNIEGSLVRKYENLSESKLLKQRARHYLPGLDKIISGQFREIYVNSFAGGCKMNALLNYGNGEVEFGTVEFGIDDNLVYHRYFQPYSNSSSTGMFSFPTNVLNDSQDESEDEKWGNVSLTNFRISPEGVLDVSFNNEKHSISIYPLRSHLLDAYKNL